jgi:hypothetical protein
MYCIYGGFMNKAIFELKQVYGNETIYPVNDVALIFASLTGKKTLNPSDLTKITQLGFEIEFKAVKPSFSIEGVL